MVDTLPQIALAQLLSGEAHHHRSDPLLPDDRVLGSLEGLVVVVVDPVEGGGHLGLLSLEHLGLGGRHCGGISSGLDVGESGSGRGFGVDLLLIDSILGTWLRWLFSVS